MRTVSISEDEVGIETNNNKIHYVPNADVISVETIVHILVNKGICTADELFMLEGNVQELNTKESKNHVVRIQNNFDRGDFSGLKKAMSKHSWSRKLGTLLFGWKWKKVKKNDRDK